MEIPNEWRPSPMAAGVTASLIAAAIVAGFVLLLHHGHEEGCAPYGIYAQNR